MAPAFWSMRRAAAAPDTTAPTVDGLDLTPATVSTAGRAALVSATVRVRDDLAGISSGGPVALTEIRLVAPGGQQVVRGWFSQANRISGNALDGTYRAQLLVPQYSQPGRWAAEVTTWDQAGNDRTYTSAALAAEGFANGVEQTGAGDTAPPAVSAFSVSPASVDTALGAQTISFSARITDDMAGVSAGTTAAPSQVTMRGPTGTHTISATFGVSQRVSGSGRDGVYATSARLPQWSEQGVWTVESLVVRDNVGNARTLGAADLVGANFVTTFTQLGAGDIVAPRFRNFTISPTAVDATSGPALIVFRARLTDDTSGVAAGVADTSSEVRYTSPSGTQHLIVQFGSAQLTNGDAFDGWYEFATTIPPGAEQGAWTASYARPVDVAHNAVLLDATEWMASGFPVSFDVRSDGTPSAPTSVHAVESGSTGAIVSWLTPEITGAGPITAYNVVAHRSGAVSADTDFSVDVDATANRATISDLVVGVTYTFTVQARNDAGTGARSSPSNAITIGGVADLESPGLTALSISPVVVQTTSAAATVSIELGVTDDASGVVRDAPFATLTFAPPPPPSEPDVDATGAVIVANREPIQAFVSLADLVTGTTLSGSYRAQLTVPQGSELGNWTLTSVTIRDASGRTRAITTAELTASGRPTVIRVEASLPPSAPRSPSATAGDSSATVSWLAPSDDGGSPITTYHVTSSPEGITASTDSNATSVVVAGLMNGVSYSFSVVAVNAAGAGEPSLPSNSVTPGALDETPPMLAAFSIEPRTHVLDGATEIVSIDARIVDGASGVADQAPVSSLTILDPGGEMFATFELGPDQLLDGTVYDARYRAEISIPADAAAGRYQVGGVILRDRSGNQASLDTAALIAAGYPDDFTLVVAPRAPSAPSAASATAGDGQVSVSWLAPADAGTAPIDAYVVVAHPTTALEAAGTSAPAVDAAVDVTRRVETTDAAPVTSTIVDGLVNGTEYTFTVAAENAVAVGPASLPSNPVTPNPAPDPNPDPDPDPTTTTVPESTTTAPDSTTSAAPTSTSLPGETTTSAVDTTSSSPESTTSVADTTTTGGETTTSSSPESSTTVPESSTTGAAPTSTSLPGETTTSAVDTTSSSPESTTSVADTTTTGGVTTTSSSPESSTTVSSTTVPGSGSPDQQAPSLAAFSIAPAIVEVGASPRSVVLSLQIVDDGSGLAAVDPRSELILRSPGGILTSVVIGSAERVNGDAWDGAYLLTFELGAGAEVGTWTVAGVVLRDAAGNQRALSDADLAAGGFDAVFVVMAPAPPAPVLSAPSPPHNVECREQAAAVVVTWAASLNSGSAPLAGYIVTASPLGARQSVSDTHTRFAGLAGARAIRFSVRAVTADGTSAASEPSGPCADSVDQNPVADRPTPPIGPLRPSVRAQSVGAQSVGAQSVGA